MCSLYQHLFGGCFVFVVVLTVAVSCHVLLLLLFRVAGLMSVCIANKLQEINFFTLRTFALPGAACLCPRVKLLPTLGRYGFPWTGPAGPVLPSPRFICADETSRPTLIRLTHSTYCPGMTVSAECCMTYDTSSIFFSFCFFLSIHASFSCHSLSPTLPYR